MAYATNSVQSNNVSVYMKDETTVGTANVSSMNKYITTSFSVPELAYPLEYSSNRSGAQVALEGQGHHVKGLNLWTFETTMKATNAALRMVWGGVILDDPADAGSFVLNNTYAFNASAYAHGATSGVEGTHTIFFENVGSDTSSAKHMYYVGCVPTGFTLTAGIGSESGETLITVNWATGYAPVLTNTGLSSPVADTGAVENIRSLHIDNTDVAGQDVVVQNYELSVTKNIERIHFSETTNYNPFGYAMTGAMEVSGTLTVLRNSSIDALIDANAFSGSSTVAINIGQETAANYSIAIPKAYLGETSMDMGGAVMTQTLAFTAVGNNDVDTAAAMMTLKTA